MDNATPIHRYNYSARADRAPAIDFTPVLDSKKRVLNPEVLSRTNQADLESTDINKIIGRVVWDSTIGAFVDPANLGKTVEYGDFTGFTDFHTMLSNVTRVQRAFEQLPVNIRNRFENNPSKLGAFIEDPNNFEEAQKLGLITKAEKPSETAAPAAPAPGQPATPAA